MRYATVSPTTLVWHSREIGRMVVKLSSNCTDGCVRAGGLRLRRGVRAEQLPTKASERRQNHVLPRSNGWLRSDGLDLISDVHG
jgi:hypothetical protein